MNLSGGVALVNPVIFSVLALDSEEPIEDLLFPNVGSTSSVPIDTTFYFNERIVASANESKMVIVTACGMKVAFLLDKVTESPCLHLDQACSWIRQPISIIMDEGAFLNVSQT